MSTKFPNYSHLFFIFEKIISFLRQNPRAISISFLKMINFAIHL